MKVCFIAYDDIKSSSKALWIKGYHAGWTAEEEQTLSERTKMLCYAFSAYRVYFPFRWLKAYQINFIRGTKR